MEKGDGLEKGNPRTLAVEIIPPFD